MAQLGRAERLYQTHLEVLEGRKTMAGSMRGRFDQTINDREYAEDVLDKYIDGYSTYSPRSKQEKVTEYLSGHFNSRGFDPVRLHSMADKNRSGSVRFGAVLSCLHKLMPQIEEEFLDRVPDVLKIGPTDEISRKEFTSLFSYRDSAGERGLSPMKGGGKALE